MLASQAVLVSDSALLGYPAGLPVPVPIEDVDGSLIKLVGDSKEVYYIMGGLKRSIPTWETFLAMKLSVEVVVMQQADFERIPFGPPMPVLEE